MAMTTSPDLRGALYELAEVDRISIAATLGAAPVGSTWRELGALED
jgi:hypothetical protein